MNTVKLKGVIDEHHRLIAEVPPDVAPGPIEVIVLLPQAPEEHDRSWEQAITAAWAADWSDPREDIYTLDDGKPIDDAR